MFTVKVRAVGQGHNWNRYPVEFEFEMNGNPTDWDKDEIRQLARKKAKDKTACDSIIMKEVEIVEKL